LVARRWRVKLARAWATVKLTAVGESPTIAVAVEASRTTPALAINYWAVVLAVVGLVLAHAANNLINDYFDMTGGVDTEGYVRALYAPHPVLSGWVTKATLRNAILLLTAIDGVIMLVLAASNQQPLLVIAFALAGLFLSVFYVAPPLNLKRHGLGELDVFLTWGPLMIGGTYLVATGTVPAWVVVFSLPYSLLVTSVLFGKHIDKIVPDTALGIRTVPVILGEHLARRLNQLLMLSFYPLILLTVLTGMVGPWVLLAVLAIPTLRNVLKVYNQPKPLEPPSWYPKRGWPLWFVGFAFRHVRLAGGLLTLGLFLNIVIPVKLPLPWL